MPHKVRPVADRFWEKVQKVDGDGCWEWRASRAPAGYGQMMVVTGQRPAYAHRLSYELNVGPIPPGMFVCHHCDNPPCVRPDHLFLGTVKDNHDDSVQKGRHKTMARKTHCIRGHKLEEYQDRQICWTCMAERTRLRRAAKKAASL